MQEEVDLLRTIPLFSRIEPSRLKLLAFTVQRLTFAPGDLLCRQGDEGDAAYIIITGDADVLVESESGPVKVATLGPNDLLGENAILCDVPRTATVKAVTKVETLMISKELFFQLINQFPSISIEIMRELARRVEKTATMLRDAMATRAGT